MARTVRNAKLDTRSARAGLPCQKVPYWLAITRGFSFGYRKGPKGGVWLAKLVIPSRLRKETTLGPADDSLDPNGVTVLSFAQAQEKAREWKAQIERDLDGGPKTPITVREAIDSYEADLEARGSDVENVSRLRAHISEDLLHTAVNELTYKDLRKWREGLVRMPSGRKRKPASSGERSKPGKLSPATVNRTCAVFKAALNHIAADLAQRISNSQTWEYGLASIRDANQARNVIVQDSVVRQIVAEASHNSPEFGLFVEVAAVTGARPSQIARLAVADLQSDDAEPRLMMPSSFKGKRGVKKASHVPVPITVDLARRLEVAAADRLPSAPLLTKPTDGKWRGGRWKKGDQTKPFKDIVERCGLSDWEQIGYHDTVTIYALRHSSIVRQIKANVPLRIIAATHDTSVGQIERNYSRYIANYTDSITRTALLDTSTPVAGNVVPIRG